ncbi:MAG: hypothetical protein LC797_07125, partial [Chloroflexi bacterium]|nr:hypothetical protein [Chloroflexota bacterium]
MHRANAAAHAAAASRPGEPCPICVRPLPEDFSAPTTSGTEQATAAQSVAQKRAKELASKLAAATESRNTAQTDLDKALDAVAQAIADRDQALDAVYTVLGHVDLDHNDEAILARVQATVRQAAAAKETAEFEAKVAHDAQTVEATELHYAERVLVDRENALAKLQQASERRKEKIAKAHGTLPMPYQVHAELTTPAIESSRRKAKQRQDELREVSLRLDTAQKQVKLLRSDKERLNQERRIVVEQPATLLSQRIQALADLSADAAQLTGLPASLARPPTLSVAKDAQWANGVLIAVGTITERCLREASTQDKVAVIAQIDGAATLAAADIANGAALATLQIDAKADERVAARDRDDAVAQQPVCAELDSRISATKPMVDSLRELASLLADGKFMAAVVKRRQRALLGIASELFQSMTKDRFAFSDDFRIVDGHTGQPREVKTLSGGETFLASLSLALALVELTSRGGGRVEALFLDEGFGSLDTNALGEALEALTRQAGGDRLVAVISHMRDVAENFDNVLVVTKTVGGSQARWASP